MSSRIDSATKGSSLERDRLLNHLLEGALDLPAHERDAYLKKHCSDSTLRREVVELLEEELGDFLEEPSAGGAGSDARDSPLLLVPLCYFAGLAMRRGDHGSARELLEKAEASQGPDAEPTPAHVVLHRNLAEVYRKLGAIDEATHQYQKAIRVLEKLPGRTQELRRVRSDLFRLQGVLQSTTSAQSVHDLLK